MTLLVVLVACWLDLIMGSSFIRDAVVIAFIANETMSIVESAGVQSDILCKQISGCKSDHRKKYADLQAVFGDNLPEYYRHYIMFGKGEKRTAV